MKYILLPFSLLIIGPIAFMCKPKATPSNSWGLIFKDTTGTLKSKSSFAIGASVNARLLNSDALYRNTLAQEFNSVTPENAMKWEAIHPAEKKYDFLGADKIVQFAVDHKARIHGHNLCWYQANPQWLADFKGNKAAWQTILREHIFSVVGRYKGKVRSWDVVNEAFDEKGQYRKANIWAEHIGNEYIEDAFRYAHEADPNALLFYNDYGQDESAAKTKAILHLINDFKVRRIPIHGVGLQMHININSSNDRLEQVMKKFAATGLLIHLSELDISINGEQGTEKTFSKEKSEMQAEKYAFIVKAYQRSIPETQRFGITQWDVGDRDSWIPRQFHHPDWPLLFDSGYHKKPAYYAFLNALQ